jgi:hypothetical protein
MALSAPWKIEAGKSIPAKLVGMNNKNISDVLLASELVVDWCYVKVENISTSKSVAACTVSATKDGYQVAQKQYGFTPNLSGENFIAQAYAHLKTLPEFANATDC